LGQSWCRCGRWLALALTLALALALLLDGKGQSNHSNGQNSEASCLGVCGLSVAVGFGGSKKIG